MLVFIKQLLKWLQDVLFGTPTQPEPPVVPTPDDTDEPVEVVEDPTEPHVVVPTEPGWYVDSYNNWWRLDTELGWVLVLDQDGIDQDYNQPIGNFAPFAEIDAPLWWPNYPFPPSGSDVVEPEPEPEPVKPEPAPLPVPTPTPAPTPAPAPTATSFTTAEVKNFLAKLGLPTSNAAQIKESTKRFQEASTWHIYGDANAKFAGALVPDGSFGIRTSHHARVSIKNDYKISPHFRLSEWRCRCKGQYAGCLLMSVSRDLVTLLEGVRRDYYPSGLTIVSGYRCTKANADVGGVKNSSHLLTPSKAADIPRKHKPGAFKGRGFHGIEVRRSHGLVTHLDLDPRLGKDHVFYFG